MSNNLEFEREKLKAETLYPEKNLVLGYVLLFFLGYLGVHRFYYGKVLTGLSMLFITILAIPTFGLTLLIVNLWMLIDIYFVYQYNETHNRQARLEQLEYLDNNQQ